MKSIISNTKGQLDINLAVTAILGLILASAFLVIGIVVLQGVVDGSDITANTTAVGTYTQSGVAVDNGDITIGTEVYTASNHTFGAFFIDYGINDTALLFAEAFAAEINRNSTIVTAVNNTAGVVTITASVSGVDGNYATTENMTNGALSAAAMSGGVDADTMYATMTAVSSDITSAMSLAGTLILVIIGVAILMLLAGVMVIMRVFR